MRIMSRAIKILDRKLKHGDLVMQIVIWQLHRSTLDRPHGLKYRLWCGRAGKTVVLYDNETGKGDHRHIGEKEEDYTFTTIDQLLDDFERDIANWR